MSALTSLRSSIIARRFGIAIRPLKRFGYVPYDCRLNHCSHESGNNENCKIYAYPLLCEKVNETASSVYPPACNGCYRKDERCDTEECTGKVTESVLECYQRHIKTNCLDCLPSCQRRLKECRVLS